MPFPFRSDDTGKLIVRITVAGLIVFHGLAKALHGIAGMRPLLEQSHVPGFLSYGVFVAELIAPVMLVAGWKSRLAALTIAFDMLMAVVLVFKSSIFSVKPAGGGWTIELEAFFFLAAIAIFFLGSGKYSVSKGAGMWD